MDINELRLRRAQLSQSSSKAVSNMYAIRDETERVAKIAQNAREILNDLDLEFERQTGLNKLDIMFLMVATALQVARWALLPALFEKINPEVRLDDKTGDQKVKQKIKDYADKHNHWHIDRSEKGYKSWKEIIFSSVPYDATKGAPAQNINMEGRYHRYKTLGHDPILGWIFGTVNIITDTITLSDFRTFEVNKMHFSHETDIFTTFMRAFESIQEEKYRLPAAVFKQGMHLQSDKFTKQGLPVPLLEVFSEELAGELYRSQYDMLCLSKDMKKIGQSAMYSILINMIVSLIHSLFYDPNEYESRTLYEVKTRKILSYSNAIASGSNVIYVAVSAYLGNQSAAKKLDIGGLLVTIYRLISDADFIQQVKEEFVFGEFNRLIQGEEYNF